MKKAIYIMLIISVVATLSVSDVNARKVIISPAKTSSITSPTETRDSRLLLLFNLPEDVTNSNVLIDFALLIFSAQVTDDKFAQIEIYPITKAWKNESEIKWDGHWDSLGGDFSTDYLESSYTLTRKMGNKEIQADVTTIVRDWKKEKITNHGFIVMISQDDLSNFDVKCSVSQSNIKLKIFYSLERK